MFSLWLDESNYQNVMLPYYRSVFKLPYSFLKAAVSFSSLRSHILYS